MYVDGVLTANAATLSSWYGHWHHIVLTNDSTQININGSSGAGTNLLTYNQATAEVDTSGIFLTGGGNTLATRVNTQAAQGSWSFQAQCTGAGDITWGIGDQARFPIKPNTQYTISGEMRAAAVVKNGRIGVWMYNQYGEYMSSTAYYSTPVALSTSAWTQSSNTFITPSWAHSAGVFFLVQSAALNDIYYGDKLGMWEGASTTWTSPPNKMWFGRRFNSKSAAATIQNVSYYPQSFTAEQAVANYKAYLGDVTTGSFSDAPGSRTVADERPKYYSNLWNSQTISV